MLKKTLGVMTLGAILSSNAIAKTVQAELTYDGFVRANYAPAFNDNSEMVIKSDGSARYRRRGYLGFTLPQGNLNHGTEFGYTLSLFQTATAAATPAAVYLITNPSRIKSNMSGNSGPRANERTKVGSFRFNPNRQQGWIRVELNRNIIRNQLDKHPEWNDRVYFQIEAEGRNAPTHVSYIAGSRYLEGHAPKLLVSADYRSLDDRSKYSYSSNFVHDAYVRGTRHYAKHNESVIKIKRDGSHYSRVAFVEVELPTSVLTSDQVSRAYFKVNQLRAFANSRVAVSIVTDGSDIKGSYQYADAPGHDRSHRISIGNLYPKRGKSDLTLTARLNVERLINYVRSKKDGDRRVLLRLEASSAGNQSYVELASGKGNPAKEPRIEIALKDVVPSKAKSVRYLRVLGMRDGHDNRSIGIREISVFPRVKTDDDTYRHAIEPVNAVIDEGRAGPRLALAMKPVLDGVASTYYTTSENSFVIPLDLGGTVDVDSVQIAHANGGVNGERFNYTILGSTDGKRWYNIAKKSETVDTKFAKSSFVSVEVADGSEIRPVKRGFRATTYNNTRKYWKEDRNSNGVGWMYDDTRVSSGADGVLKVWVPEIVKGHRLVIRANTDYIYNRDLEYELKEGFNAIPVKKGYWFSFAGRTEKTTSWKHPEIAYSLENGISVPNFILGRSSDLGFKHWLKRSRSDQFVFGADTVSVIDYKDNLFTTMKHWEEIDYAKLAKQYKTSADILDYAYGYSDKHNTHYNKPYHSNRLLRGKYHTRGGYMATTKEYGLYRWALTRRVFNSRELDSGSGFWGTWHEFGHQMQSSAYMWNGTGELTCNFGSINNYFQLRKDNIDDVNRSFDKKFLIARNHIDSIHNFVWAKKDTIMMMFYQLYNLHGDTIFGDISTTNRKLLTHMSDEDSDYLRNARPRVEKGSDEWYAHNQKKMDYFVEVVSVAMGQNMVDFFHNGWKFNLSRDAMNRIASRGLKKGPAARVASMSPYQIQRMKKLPHDKLDGLPN